MFIKMFKPHFSGLEQYSAALFSCSIAFKDRSLNCQECLVLSLPPFYRWKIKRENEQRENRKGKWVNCFIKVLKSELNKTTYPKPKKKPKTINKQKSSLMPTALGLFLGGLAYVISLNFHWENPVVRQRLAEVVAVTWKVKVNLLAVRHLD